MNCSGPSRASPTRSCPSGWSDLEKSGLVNRIDYQEKSPRVEYTLTQTGKFAYQIICEISIWGYKYELANSRFVISQ